MWLNFQIGAREHYAIPRALHASGNLAGLFTDFWVPPGHLFGRLPGARRLRDRWHTDLAQASVHAPNGRILAFELKQQLARRSGWDANIARNKLFQHWAVQELATVSEGHKPRLRTTKDAPHAQGQAPGTKHQEQTTVFSYSYAALAIFRFAKSRGWRTVLGQIDPGPEEERIVAAERERYRHLASSWQPAPTTYWESWREELDLADRIIVNSEWSRQCLLKENVPSQKIEVVPLVYSNSRSARSASLRTTGNRQPKTDNLFNVLFLGQINLRKGAGRLLDAMRLLKDEPVELTLAGPSQVDPSAWLDLPNVRGIGTVPRSEVGRYYEGADLFILPTLSDGYALTQLEALSHGLPVLASKHCGEAVTHGRNGWILEDLEPETIAAAIRHAIAEPLDPAQVHPPEFSLQDLATALIE